MKVRQVKPNFEKRILDAISWAKKQDLRIVSIMIPKLFQEALVVDMDLPEGKNTKLKTIFGIPVKLSKKLAITTEIL